MKSLEGEIFEEDEKDFGIQHVVPQHRQVIRILNKLTNHTVFSTWNTAVSVMEILLLGYVNFSNTEL